MKLEGYEQMDQADSSFYSSYNKHISLYALNNLFLLRGDLKFHCSRLYTRTIEIIVLLAQVSFVLVD